MMKMSDKDNEGRKLFIAHEDLYDGVKQIAPKKRQVFRESDGYLMDLVSRSTDNAIQTVRRRQARRSWALRITGVSVGVAAVFALVVSIMPRQLDYTDEVQHSSVAQTARPVKTVAEAVTTSPANAEPVRKEVRATESNAVVSESKPQATTSTKQDETEKSPIDEFLNSISDEDAEQLAYYSTPEIPEY